MAKKNGTSIAGATSAALTIAAVQVSDAGSYTVLLTDKANQRVTRSDAGILTLGPLSNVITQNIIHNLRSKWLNTQLLEISGLVQSAQKMLIVDIKGKVWQNTIVSKGFFTKQFLLKNNGIYLITFEGNRSFTPVIISQVSN